MRLITYDRGGARRLGAWVGETVVDLPEAVGHPAFPPTMEALVQHIGGSILDAAHDILEDGEVVDECTVPRAKVLPPLISPPGPIAFVDERGRASALETGCFAAGLACIVGGRSRTRKISGPEPPIFGFTLVAHGPMGDDGAFTRLGPCVVTPEELTGADLRLDIRINGRPCGDKTIEAPLDLFGRAMASRPSRQRFEPGAVLAFMPWTFRSDDAASPFPGRVVQLSASPIGLLRMEPPPVRAR